jgi:hypothetical protein
MPLRDSISGLVSSNLHRQTLQCDKTKQNIVQVLKQCCIKTLPPAYKEWHLLSALPIEFLGAMQEEACLKKGRIFFS